MPRLSILVLVILVLAMLGCSEPTRRPQPSALSTGGSLPVGTTGGSGTSKTGGAGWWCIDKPPHHCESRRENCEGFASLPGLEVKCVEHSTAWCHQTCRTDAFTCSWNCAPSREACDALPLDPANERIENACRERAAPQDPDLYPNFFEPGWWCSELPGDQGSVSMCTKPRVECEGTLDAMLAQAGWSRDRVPGVTGKVECRRAEQPVWCYRMEIESPVGRQPRFMCSITEAQCSVQVQQARARAPDGVMRLGSTGTMRIGDRCEKWRYD